MLNSVSTLRQYFWHHRSQCDCLYYRKHRHISDMDEPDNERTNTNEHNSPPNSRWVSVVFTFNISAICFTPASPIALPNRTTKGVQCITKSTPEKTKHQEWTGEQTRQFTYFREKSQLMSCSLSMLLQSAQPHLLQYYCLFIFKKKIS